MLTLSNNQYIHQYSDCFCAVNFRHRSLILASDRVGLITALTPPE